MTVQELNFILGKNIKMYREKKGLTQDWLGIKLGDVWQGTISRYEIGKSFPHPLMIIGLADILGVEPWQLFYDHEIMVKAENMPSVLLTAKEAMPLLKCGYAKIRKLANAGKIGHKRIGNRYLFSHKQIQDFLDHNNKEMAVNNKLHKIY